MSKSVVSYMEEQRIASHNLNKKRQQAFAYIYYYEVTENADEILNVVNKFDKGSTNIFILVLNRLIPISNE